MEERQVINQMLQDEDIQNFINQNKVTNQEFEAYLSNFFNYYFNIKKCRDCKGHCTQERKYLKPILVKDGQYIDLDYEKCQYSVNNYLDNITFLSSSLDQNGEIEFKDPRRHEVLTYIKNYLNNLDSSKQDNDFDKGLYLYGKYGTGKSYILQYVACELAKKGHKVIFVYYPDFARIIKSMITTGGVEDIIDDLKSIEFLFIDDLGGDANSQFVRDEILLPVLQHRMVNKKPLFVSSNLSLDELSSHFALSNKDTDALKAKRIIERIRTLCKDIELKGDNHRK